MYQEIFTKYILSFEGVRPSPLYTKVRPLQLLFNAQSRLLSILLIKLGKFILLLYCIVGNHDVQMSSQT